MAARRSRPKQDIGQAIKPQAQRAGQAPGAKGLLQYVPYVILVVLVSIYAIYNNVIIGIAIFLFIIALVVTELKTSIKSEGAKKSITDVAIALVIAVSLWGILIFTLQTKAPIDAVASCSMLPVLHRGDLVFLHGITNATSFVMQEHVPVINVSRAAFSTMYDGIQSEYLAYFAYVNNNASKISEYVNATNYPVALYNTACLDTLSLQNKQNQYYKCMVTTQYGNLIRYNYSIGNVTINGVHEFVVQTSKILVGSTVVSENFSNPIIVYQTTSQDYFGGDIIHRLVAVIRTGSSYYFLTRGDNNPALDIEFGNYPPSTNQTLGYTVFDMPALGYIKLILGGQVGSVPGCNQQIQR